jgi:UrcA family protein
MIRLTAAVALAAALIAAPAFAADTTQVTARVRTNDLNLQSPEGAKIALERINKAAKSACSDTVVGSRLADVDMNCVADTTAKLVRSLQAPMVQAAYDAQKANKTSEA